MKCAILRNMAFLVKNEALWREPNIPRFSTPRRFRLPL
jgi:hypothetical protein